MIIDDVVYMFYKYYSPFKDETCQVSNVKFCKVYIL